MEKYLPTISKYKRKLCHASIYRQIRKTKNREIKRKLQAAYKKHLSQIQLSITISKAKSSLKFHTLDSDRRQRSFAEEVNYFFRK